MSKCIVDTNVPLIANLAERPDPCSDVPDYCIRESVDRIESIIEEGCLVIDAAGEIFQEYINKLSLRGQPGIGDAFAKWVNDHQFTPGKVDRVPITKDESGSSYNEFPDDPELKGFDRSDRKFVAVAKAHPETEKPSILQAADSKWWGWKDALDEHGITVVFLCQEYVEEKYADKMGT